MKTEKAKSNPNRIVRLVGLVLIVVGIPAICVGAIFLHLDAYFNGYSMGIRPIPGDAAKFDPIASYPQIMQFAGGDVKLLSINMKFIKADGTLDLTADYGAEVDYAFAHELDSPPTIAAPLGAVGTPSSINAESITVHLEKPMLVSFPNSSTAPYYNFGMRKLTGKPEPLKDTIIDTPTCTLKQLWNAAITKDVPANAVATIQYGIDGYTFSIDGTQIQLKFDTNCQLKN